MAEAGVSEEALAQFIGITGQSADEARAFLAMTGGDLDQAVNLFFSDGAMAPVTDAIPTADVETPAWWRIIWPADAAPPEAWREQCMTADETWQGGLPQPKNGPCGVLAVVHAEILLLQHTADVGSIKVSAEAVSDAICRVLLRCRPDTKSPVHLVRPLKHGAYGPESEIEVLQFADEEALRTEVKARAANFCGPGGVIDLVYSAVFTRGVDEVRREAQTEGGELPLVTQAFSCWLCTTELMSLLLRGNAAGNIGAFRADASRNGAWDGSEIGLLSRQEKETGIPVAEGLKGPSNPVWILHGGDHFTLAWCSSMPSMDVGATFTLHHWNGLPPGGPKLGSMNVRAVNGTQRARAEPPKFFKPVPGEVDDVVQADPDDKKAYPDEYRRWKFEVVLAIDDPDVQGEERPVDAKPPTIIAQDDPRYQRGGAWRCRSCYAKRFQTMDFQLIPAESPDWCPKCNKSRKESGWSLWLPFSDLPDKAQAQIMERHAKKIETILWTRWPACEVVSLSDSGLPSC
mmetsp:Transcript_48046/g.88498  ORF Transcript_48046/g.88498 Transcript_48046/m.88498 type:complete len:516 (+) Transcript_48046:48-1595(+)